MNTQLKTNCPSKNEIATSLFTFICENFIRNSGTSQIKEGIKKCIKLIDALEDNEPKKLEVFSQVMPIRNTELVSKIRTKIDMEKIAPDVKKKKSRKQRCDKGIKREMRKYKK